MQATGSSREIAAARPGTSPRRRGIPLSRKVHASVQAWKRASTIDPVSTMDHAPGESES